MAGLAISGHERDLVVADNGPVRCCCVEGLGESEGVGRGKRGSSGKVGIGGREGPNGCPCEEERDPGAHYPRKCQSSASQVWVGEELVSAKDSSAGVVLLEWKEDKTSQHYPHRE